jgi:hypothetical protein
MRANVDAAKFAEIVQNDLVYNLEGELAIL